MISARKYTNGYIATRTNPFAGWGGDDRNETGLYQGLKIKLNRHNITVFGDFYKEDTEPTLSNFSKSEKEYGFRWEWEKNKKYFRFQKKSETKTSKENISFLGDSSYRINSRQSTKLLAYYPFTEQFSLKSQVYFTKSIHNNITEHGTVIESVFFWTNNFLTTHFQGVTTWIDSYDARVYFLDLNLPGEMCSNMFSSNVHSSSIKLLYIKQTSGRRTFQSNMSKQRFKKCS